MRLRLRPQIIKKGGSGSGDYGHAGRPGEVGGSSGELGVMDMDPASGLPSKTSESKKNWYRSWAKNDFGFKGQVDFQGSPPGSTIMGFYDPENGKVMITDLAVDQNKGISALAHETSHAKFDEVFTAMVNDDKRISKFSSMWDKNEKKIISEGKNIGSVSEYAKSFWDDVEYGDDLDLAVNETFAEFSRLGKSEESRTRLSARVGTDSAIWQLYLEFRSAYDNLH